MIKALGNVAPRHLIDRSLQRTATDPVAGIHDTTGEGDAQRPAARAAGQRLG
jgi:hypothetical protein